MMQARTPSHRSDAEELILVLAPTGRDGPLIADILTRAGHAAEACADVGRLCARIDAGAGAVVLAEEVLTGPAVDGLVAALERQPPWSDLPLIVLTGGEPAACRGGARALAALAPRGNVTLLERPVRIPTMATAVAAALRARRRQYAFRRLLAEKDEAVRQRDQFLAMLGHELRNPLAAIRNAMRIMDLMDWTRDAVAEHRPIIDRQTRHLTRLVDDLLDVSRITSGKIILERDSVDLNDLVRRAAEAMRPTFRANRQRLAFEPAGGPVTVEGDAVRLEQVVTNLLTNAAKYTQADGRIDVAVAREGNEAVLRVRDTGIGIAPRMLSRIFDLFAQADESLERSQGGMGIGLTVVQKLVQMQGGSVTADSRGIGHGSEFVVRLPLLAVAADPPGAPARVQAAAGGVCRRVLVVEDNPDARRTLARLLRLFGHQVETAEDGPQGAAKALADRPDVVLLDIGLPGMDGYEVARRVRAEVGDGIFLVALTGYGQPQDRCRAAEAGFDVHLVKPVDGDHLARVLADARA